MLCTNVTSRDTVLVTPRVRIVVQISNPLMGMDAVARRLGPHASYRHLRDRLPVAVSLGRPHLLSTSYKVEHLLARSLWPRFNAFVELPLSVRSAHTPFHPSPTHTPRLPPPMPQPSYQVGSSKLNLRITSATINLHDRPVMCTTTSLDMCLSFMMCSRDGFKCSLCIA